METAYFNGKFLPKNEINDQSRRPRISFRRWCLRSRQMVRRVISMTWKAMLPD
jgi:hypothetical protein